jgi:hypothetical protein
MFTRGFMLDTSAINRIHEGMGWPPNFKPPHRDPRESSIRAMCWRRHSIA